jgi:hypothetical protein
MRTFGIWLGFFVVAALPLLARGAEIEDLTTHTILFNDDYTNLSAISGSPALDTSVMAPPVAEIGTEYVFSDVSGFNIQVTDSTTSPDPGPAPGDGPNYLRIYRDPANASNQLGQLCAATDNTLGDVVQYSTMVNVPNDGANARFQMIMSGQFTMPGGVNTSTSANAWVRPDGNGNVVAIGPGLATESTGLTYTPGVWQQWDMTYVVGSGTFTVTVNGVTSGNLNCPSGFNGVAGVAIFNGNSTPGGSADFAPVPTPILLGDFNQDGHVNAADLSVMLQALANPAAYEAEYNLTYAQLQAIGNINGDGQFNNAQVQAFLNLLKSGGGSTTAVPEPASVLLAIGSFLGVVIVWRTSRRTLLSEGR